MMPLSPKPTAIATVTDSKSPHCGKSGAIVAIANTSGHAVCSVRLPDDPLAVWFLNGQVEVQPT